MCRLILVGISTLYSECGMFAIILLNVKNAFVNSAECDLGVGDVDSRSEPRESAPGGACHGPD